MPTSSMCLVLLDMRGMLHSQWFWQLSAAFTVCSSHKLYLLLSPSEILLPFMGQLQQCRLGPSLAPSYFGCRCVRRFQALSNYTILIATSITLMGMVVSR